MYYCIVNPSARSGKGKEIWDRLEKKLKKKGLEYRALFTEGPGDATKLARRVSRERQRVALGYDSDGYIRIVVLGGDGTLNEVMNGIEDFDRTLVGYIPIGSSNDFARDLSFPKKTDELIDLIIRGEKVRSLDLGRLTYNSMSEPMSRLHEEKISKTRIFDVSAGIGFDAAVCEEALSSSTKNFFNKIGLGKLTYGVIAIRELLSAPKVPCVIELDDGTKIHFKNYIFIAMMIHHYEGGGFNFAPGADLSDGKFDLCYAGDIHPAKMMLALPCSFFGHYYWIKGIGHHVVSKVTIKTKEPMWVHTDGEVAVKSDNITVECLKQKLNLMC